MKGYLRLVVSDKDNNIVSQRCGGNAVMLSGGQMLAQLFSGGGTGITHMGVGTNDQVDTQTYDIAALSNEAFGESDPLTGDTEVGIVASAFSIENDTVKRIVKVSLRATLPPSAAVGTIREAGLLSIDSDERLLYNRIVFDPVTKGDDHELTMFWDVSFPYGDLQWF
ncbi:MAG: hypothetical protein COA42_11750 [Alteromonadaceae bacterium]|nr:MAG: hypothetical protein COA42_11750 [Alteromonadaceae bacterium]